MTDGATAGADSFGRYWRAQAASGAGTYVTLFALQVLVVQTLDGGAVEVGWLNAARWAPYLVIGLLVGALVDGRRKLPLMIASDLIQAVLLMLIPLLWWVGLLSMPVLLVVVLGYGFASVVNGSAATALLPRIVPRERLQRANARLDGADAAGSTGGPAAAGAIAGWVGAPATVLVDAASYLYSAWTLSRMTVVESIHRSRVTRRGVRADIAAGIRWAYGHSGLAAMSIATHGWFVGNAVVGVVVTPYALRELELSTAQFGLVGAVGGVAAVLGAVITGAVGRLLGTGPTVILCHGLSAAAAVVMACAAQFSQAGAALGVGQALYGLALGMSNSHEMSYRQAVTPDDLHARTNTTLRSFNRAIMVVVAPLAGLAAAAWGSAVLLIAAAGVFVVVTVGLASTQFRHVRGP